MRRYQLHESIGEGGMGVVYRATDRLSGEPVALKQIATSAYDDYRLALAREFRTLAGLRHPHIVSVLDYGFEEEKPFFTMQLLEGARPANKEATPSTIDARVKLLLNTLSALSYLHRRGVLHRDLKPGNVLILPNGEVRVVDFGLALTGPSEENGHGIPGTPAYMAPELFGGKPATPASDLYALGVMAYEMFAGGHPYDTSSLIALYRDLARKIPDLEPVPMELRAIIGRLLAKEAPSRYQRAEDVIAALYQALGREVPAEDEALRESFLQASAFVGREREFATLTEALEAMKGGTGSTWLIGGESGVGKSRLADELRTHALVEGVTVTRGQGVQAGGRAYEYWREALRPLVLQTELPEATAGILKEIIPDISQLLGRPIPDVPPLEGQPGQQRLSAAIVDLLRLQGPTLIILEDLQWAEESLELLKMVTTAGLPMVIVGTYRIEERPHLPDEIDGAHLLELKRLPFEHVEELAQAMIGQSDDAMVAFIHEQTEGNVLFMVEVLRVMAEEAGRLDAIPNMTLPDYIVAGGMLSVLQRRLERVPKEYQEALRLTAVAGRWLDVDVIGHFTEDVERFLQAGGAAAVFEVVDNRWRFSHDKLRETLLNSLEDAAVLHRRVAEAIEAAHPDDEGYAVALADHWHAAGDTAKEAFYVRQAAEQYLIVSNFSEVLRLTQRAVEGTPEDAELIHLMALAHFHLSDYEAAKAGFERLRAVSPTHKGQALLGIGRVYRYMRQDEQARDYLRRALTLFRERGAKEGMGHALYNLGVIEVLNAKSGDAVAYLTEAIDVFEAENMLDHVGHSQVALGVYHQKKGDIDLSRERYRAGLSIHRSMGNLLGENIALENLGIIEDITGNYVGAEEYYQESISLSQRIGDSYGAASALRNLGAALRRQRRNDEARAVLSKSRALSNQLGDEWGVALGDSNLAMVHLSEGRLDEAEEVAERSLASFEKLDDHGRIATVAGTLAKIRALQGRRREALALLHRMFTLEGGEEGVTWGALADATSVYYHLGEHERAAELTGLMRVNQKHLSGDALVNIPRLLETLADRDVALRRGEGFSKEGTIRSILGATRGAFEGTS